MYQNSKQSLGTVEYDENYLKEELYNLLKQDKSIFDFIQNSALDGLWFWDLEYPENEWMNPKFWITLGYDPNQMPHLSSTWQNIINQDDLALALDNFNDHCEDPSCPYDQIVRYTHKLGHTVWIHCRGIIIRDSKGKPTRMLEAHTDVTKLKKTELKLRHQVERYQHIIESTDLGTWEWNMQIDRLICNERWAEILGFTLLELEPITMDTFKKSIHPSDLEKFEKNVAQHFIGETLFYKFEVRVKHKNGEWIWVLNRGKIVSWTKQDEPEWIIGSLQEITQSKKDLEKHKLFIEQAPSAIAMFDKNMCYIAHSKKWKVDYSISEENIIGKSHYEIFPEIGENWKKDHQNCLSGKILSSDEDRFEREDGSVQWLSWKLHPWYKSNNEVGGIIMLTTDITKIKDTEIQLRLSEKKFRENFENAAIGMAILDLKGKWLEVNDTLCSIVGYTSEELLGLTFQDITYSDDLSKDLELFQELLDGDRSYYHMEKRYLHKKGHIVHVILSASIIRDENEKPLYFISQITDITLRVNANQKLKETLAQLEGVLEASTQVSIIETNLEGVITKFNKGAENLLGYKRDEVINKETVKLIHLDEEVLEYGYELSKELGKEINGYDIIETPLNRQKHLNKEWTYVKKDGTKFPVQLATTAIKINNSITGYLRVATNISEIKEVEKEIKSLLQVANEQNERLKNFAHIVSHNLKSHSGNFNMLLDLFIQENPDFKNHEIIKLFNMASNDLTETIGHLNEVVLMNTSVDQNLVGINLCEAIDRVVNSVAMNAKKLGVRIINEVEEHVTILGIPAYLDSILLNFTTNGIKYRSPKRDSYLIFNTYLEGDFIVLNIEDNGLGIDLNKHHAKLFGMYKTFHRNKEARGIGLFITKNQVEAIGGKIDVESQVDKGTTFKIYIQNEKN